MAAEDTRVAAALFRRHDLHTRLVSYHDHNEESRTAELLAHLQGGADLALLSDAGTPLIRDPGFRLVRACVDAGVPVDVLPGPCAAIAALAGSGLPVDRFHFLGFLPAKEGERRAALAEAAGWPGTLVLYESPKRLPELLDTLAELWPTRPVCVARNLTKEHEQWIRGTAAEARGTLGDEERGEVTLLVGGAEATGRTDADVDAEILRLLAEGLETKAIRDRVAAWSGWARRDVYARVLTLK